MSQSEGFAEERRQRTREFVVIAMFGLLIGGALGWWGERTARGVSAPPPPPLLQEPREVVESAEETEGNAEMRAWMEMLAAMGRRVVPEGTVSRLAFSLLDEEGRVSEAGRELFLLTDEESERINRLVAEMKERLVLAEMMHLEILEVGDRAAVFLIPVLEEGEEIENALREGLLEILGDADGNLFWSLLRRREADGSPDLWRGFGRREREILFALSDEDPREIGETPVSDDVAGWLRYEERVAEDLIWSQEDETASVADVKRVRPLRVGDESGLGAEWAFFDPRRERYGFLVPFLPDALRDYFQ